MEVRRGCCGRPLKMATSRLESATDIPVLFAGKEADLPSVVSS
jgi:hypothetical protein